MECLPLSWVLILVVIGAIPHCLRTDGGTLCQCRPAGWLAANNVCPSPARARHYGSEDPELRHCT
jgi:hypothetical protein